ncbi:MAG: penicillin-binding protein [Candidatus Moranbacteria bacterium]|nr:penicillin-binding protein [Candidatus Moranbacteria bacterium]
MSLGKTLKIVCKKTVFFIKDVLFVLLLVSFFSCVGILIGVWYLYKYEVPEIERLHAGSLSQTSVLYDRTGKHVLYELYGEENRKIITHENIPDVMRMATLAGEDVNFYQHYGVDPRAIVRALRANLKSGSIEEGGSTLTMQLVRNLYLYRAQTFERKVIEALMAFRLETMYTKDEIFDWYLNTVPYGSNTYGIQSASETFFGKDAKDLTLDEASFLAVLPKATTFFSPYGENISSLKANQRKILDTMLDKNMISFEHYRDSLSIDTFSKVQKKKNSIIAPHFVFYTLSQLQTEYGEELLRIGGLRILTTLDMDMQKKAEEMVLQRAKENQLLHNAENASLVALNPKTGEILAMVGSRNYFDETIDGEVNVATSPRQPGSAFKPIAYAKALELGLQPDTVLYDVPTSFGPDGSGGEYRPQNYNQGFSGLVSLKKALAMSLNIPAVKILYIAGLDNTIELAGRLGITTLNDRNRYGLSLVLGGGEVSLLELTGAFSVFANDGVRNDIKSIMNITGMTGNQLDFSKQEEARVLDVQIARKINSMLSDNDARSSVFGSQSSLFIPEYPNVAVKTGTTQEYRDGWTVGYTPNIAVGIWTGNNDNRPMKAGSPGVYTAAPLWNDYMRYVLERLSEKEEFITPDAWEKSSLPMINGRGSGRSLLYYIDQAKFSGAPRYDREMISRWDSALKKPPEDEKTKK